MTRERLYLYDTTLRDGQQTQVRSAFRGDGIAMTGTSHRIAPSEVAR